MIPYIALGGRKPFRACLHQSRHCGHFLIFFLQIFSKMNKRTPTFIPESRVEKSFLCAMTRQALITLKV